MDPQNNSTQNNPSSNTPPMLDAGNHNMLMGILSYIGPLVIISFLVSKNDSFVKFHIKQGFVVFGIEVIAWVAAMIIYPLWIFMPFVHLALFVLSIIGIINVVQKKEKELPLVGSLSKYVKI